MTKHKDISQHINHNYCLKTDIVSNNIISVEVIAKDLSTFMNALRSDELIRMESLLSICCVDYPSRTRRFELVYNFINYTNNQRLIVKLQAKNKEIVQSVSSIFPNALWYEREIWDMYGVLFKDHPDMRRILTDYGFVGHPMRKDFPLTGYTEVYYNDFAVSHRNVALDQDLRVFDFQSAFKDAQYRLLPGDEKANR